jgi:hypothetical protein
MTRLVRRVLRDDRGGAMENLGSMSISWYVMFSVFLMNVQLGQSYHQRDMVDHAASVAADTVTKTLCADAKDYGGVAPGNYQGARKQAVDDAVSPILGLVAPKDACKLDVKNSSTAGGGGDPGKKDMSVGIACEIPCRVPFAAQVMCKGSPRHVSFQSKRAATVTGCDSGS